MRRERASERGSKGAPRKVEVDGEGEGEAGSRTVGVPVQGEGDAAIGGWQKLLLEGAFPQQSTERRRTSSCYARRAGLATVNDRDSMARGESLHLDGARGGVDACAALRLLQLTSCCTPEGERTQVR